MLLLSLALCLMPVVLGIAIASALKLFEEKMALALVGAAGGLAMCVTVTYIVTLAVPLHAATLLALIAAAAIVTVLLLATTRAWQHFWQLPSDWTAALVVALALLLFSIIAPKLLVLQEGGLYTGIINAYGDIAWHMANITAFAEGQSLPPQNPIFAGVRLTYPFLSNFFSAVLLVGGANYAQSVALPAMLLIPVLLGLVYVLTRDLAEQNIFSPAQRKWAGIIAVLLFLFGGATFGVLRVWNDWQGSGQGLGTFLTHLPDRDYSGVGADPDGYHFLNPVTTLLLPQRSFLFGLPLALVIVLLLTQPHLRPRAYIAAGVIAGLLPLFHAHTVVALLPVLAALFLLRPHWHWLFFVLAGCIVGIPEVAYYLGNTAESGSFMRFDPGWTADGRNIVWFWLQNTGFLIPVALAGMCLPLGRTVRAVAGAAFLIFLVANLFLFAPWAWDNFKLLVFWLLFTLPLVGYVAVYAWQRRPRVLMGIAVVLIVLLQISAGTLDVWKLALPTAATWSEWDSDGIAIADKIKRVTAPGESVLTAPIHNTPVVLAGRPLYLGYAAHVWSHGGLPWNRENAIQPFYEGKIEQLPETQPTYVLLGPVEKDKYPQYVIRPHWQLVAQSGAYGLYKIR